MLDPRFRFDTFVVGSANRLAVAAARAVADAPGQVYNPLFIYGHSGLGKTHLMGAIADLAADRKPGLRREYATLDDFVEQMHAAIAAREPDRMKQRYHDVDLLLLDDVQFLTRQPETQGELLRLLNALQSQGRQIVMASDRPPADIADVDERLISRLAGGLVVDLGAPDFETRAAILRSVSGERGVNFAPGVVEELAAIEFHNVRELQGALNRLIAFQMMAEEQVQPAQVRGIVGGALSATPAAGNVFPAAGAGVRSELPPGTPVQSSPLIFESFLSDMAVAVARNVEGWKVRVSEAMGEWAARGYRTALLEDLLSQDEPPADWESLLRGFGAAVERLQALEAQAVSIEPSLAGAAVFRDPGTVTEAERTVDKLVGGAAPPSGPDQSMLRSTFEVSASNQLAARAVDEIAADPGRRYNPLFIHGATGSGKTHLANALGNELVDSSGGAARVAVVRAAEFMGELIGALQAGTVGLWRARYRVVDALVLDDVQQLADTERTQDELFHLFNALYSDGKQLVFTSDRQPRALDGLEERLRSRLGGGLVAELQPPDRQLRERLAARVLSDVDPTVSPELITWFAEPEVASVGELLTRLHRVADSVAATGAALTVEHARTMLAAGNGSSAASGDAPAAATLRLSGSMRVSGGMRPSGSMLQVDPDGPGDAFFRDTEKVVWEWPDSARIIEDPR